MLSLKLENSAHSAKFRPTQLDDNQRYVVVDLETHNSSTVLGKELTGELLSEIAGNKNSWIVEIRPEKARL